MKATSLLFCLCLLIGVAEVTAATDGALFEPDSHCVAYRAQRTMFFLSTAYVIGKNCDISAQVLPEVGGLYRIEVNIPIKSFSSGDVARDADVSASLKIETRPDLVFKSKAMSVESWHSLFDAGQFILDGELTIGDKFYPVKLATKYVEGDDSVMVEGATLVKFSDFAIVPPKVAGGVVARAKPDLELHFHLLSSRILGANTIRPTKLKAHVVKARETLEGNAEDRVGEIK